MAQLITDRLLRRALLVVALMSLFLWSSVWLSGHPKWSFWIWWAGTLPVVIGLAVSMTMTRDLLAGRLGVDAVAFASMSAALVLGEPLAGASSR